MSCRVVPCSRSCLSNYLSAYLSPCLSIYLSVCLPTYLCTCKLENEAILRDFLNFRRGQHQKLSNSSRLPQFWNMATSKTKKSCETSQVFEVDNIKNEAILRDCLQKWKVECSADGCTCHEKVRLCFSIVLWLQRVEK